MANKPTPPPAAPKAAKATTPPPPPGAAAHPAITPPPAAPQPAVVEATGKKNKDGLVSGAYLTSEQVNDYLIQQRLKGNDESED